MFIYGNTDYSSCNNKQQRQTKKGKDKEKKIKTKEDKESRMCETNGYYLLL